MTARCERCGHNDYRGEMVGTVCKWCRGELLELPKNCKTYCSECDIVELTTMRAKASGVCGYCWKPDDDDES